MTKECENTETAPAGIPGEQPGAPNPSKAGVNKDDSIGPDKRIPQADQPMPAGSSMEITKIWNLGVTTGPQGSLADQEARDQKRLTASTRVLDEFGAGGLDKVNFEVKADLTTLDEKANMVYYLYWDGELIKKGQINLPDAASTATVRERTEWMPDKIFKRAPGEHELKLSVQLRTDQQTGPMQTGDSKAWSEEFPRVGASVTRTVPFIITD